MSTAAPAKHPVACQGCNAFPIVGVRLQSAKVPSVDLCKPCALSAKWTKSHAPFSVHKAPPSHLTGCSGCNAPRIVGPKATSTKDPNFELCAYCIRSGKFNRSHGPFNVLHGTATHRGTTCGGCRVSPIAGPRIRSTTNTKFDLCASCAVSGAYNKSHGPFRIRIRPPVVHPGSECIACDNQKAIVGPRYQSTQHPFAQLCKRCHDSNQYSDELGPFVEWKSVVVHAGVQCNSCKVMPIGGPRYKSKTYDNYDLCQSCVDKGSDCGPFIKMETPTEHAGIFCDGCKIPSILGIRYRSLTTANYDFCYDCVEVSSVGHKPFQLLLRAATTATPMTPIGTVLRTATKIEAALDFCEDVLYLTDFVCDQYRLAQNFFGDGDMDVFEGDYGFDTTDDDLAALMDGVNIDEGGSGTADDSDVDESQSESGDEAYSSDGSDGISCSDGGYGSDGGDFGVDLDDGGSLGGAFMDVFSSIFG
ncbi:hypothetical protein SDRG_06448 [Saprolegnia diclina VS20]|uniref:ZZ-type domain-containing protein n=1 Tax=Saprolegnia diclina (strain VS20) TaxID=1156394 RepID=T0RV22_SAPDV|nr:hypothetical protein SDRG_06448 [Saprolegnia diclina VS20]EQC36343.1 hypothetical protein SDRG_06448 [Saprolegnia diclina VS20]|eukprot:XP_008610449.1 hypothetical protein SDRG_06448 [Saprolegnia diclina VS20]